MHEDTHLRILKFPHRYITAFCIHIQAEGPQMSKTNIQKWRLILESGLTWLRYEGKSLLCLVRTYAGPGRRRGWSQAEFRWVKLGWPATYLETHHYHAVWNILEHHSIRDSGCGKQSRAPTVFSKYINSVERTSAHSSLCEYMKVMWISCFVLSNAFSH